MMADAERGGYAVGYFESWNLESLQGVLDAAEDARAPVILGFSGLNLPDPSRLAPERLELYAALGRSACAAATVPTVLLFNESPYPDWIRRALDLGFNLVMFADEHCPPEELVRQVRATVALATGRAAVEAEMRALPGVAQGLEQLPDAVDLTDPEAAAVFVAQTGIDALAVSLGNVHLHGRRKVGLDLARLEAIRQRVNVPLVLHGASSVDDQALRQAVRGGIRKINVGSALRTAFYSAVRDRVRATGDTFNPYEVLGSGSVDDILLCGRLAVRVWVYERLELFGSAGRAGPGSFNPEPAATARSRIAAPTPLAPG
jgi:ketose-bisphosphate aldolase